MKTNKKWKTTKVQIKENNRTKDYNENKERNVQPKHSKKKRKKNWKENES